MVSRVVVLGMGVLLACSSPDSYETPAGMALVPGGKFARGSRPDDPRVYDWEKPREQPQHLVQVDAFFMDVHEVTNREFERFRLTHRRNVERSPCDDCPVVEVSWFDAAEYCAAQEKRLPTEAEWEKAAKGGSDMDPTPLGDYAWFSKNSITRARSVAQKEPNGYGLYDMLGNVREWTADWYEPAYYRQKVRANPKGPGKGARRVERGGAFFLPARGVTTTIRYNHPPHFQLYFLGFRCAQDAPPVDP